jgi:hypothetical protein
MARKGMIRFRCWYCNRTLAASWDQVGERRVCNCGERYRVPRRGDISRRDKRILDRFLEVVIYGIGGGFLGILVGLMLGAESEGLLGFAVAAGVGFLIGGLTGGLFGERGINWIGSLLRNLEGEENH